MLVNHALKSPGGSSVYTAAARRPERDEVQDVIDYLEENPDATFEEAYLRPYDKGVKKAYLDVDSGPMRANVALMGGLAALHPLAGYALGVTSGFGLGALGVLSAVEGHQQDDSNMVKSGLWNAAIGASMVAAPFIPGYPMAARLAPLGLMGLREIWVRRQQNRPTLKTLPALPAAPNPASRALPSLAGSAAAVALSEVKNPAEARLGQAFNNLAKAGWTFKSLRGEEGYLEDLAPQSAFDYMRGPRDTSLGDGDRLLLLHPDHQTFTSSTTWHHVVDAEGVAAVDFFFGSGDRQVVADPELAETLQNMSQVGVQMGAPHRRYRFSRGASATYLSYLRDHPTTMTLEGVSLVDGKPDRDQVVAFKTFKNGSAEYRRFLEDRLLGASVRDALKAPEREELELEMEENTITIGGFSVEVH